MTIAINSTSFITSAGNDFFYNHFRNLAASKPEHQFIFIISPVDKVPGSFQNITYIISSPRANNPLMWTIWLNYTLPAIAKKHNADILINTNGIGSLRSRLPQLLFISDLYFLNFPQFFPKKQSDFLKKKHACFFK